METFTITSCGGAYSVVATDADGKSRAVATYPTEDGAAVLLRRLQERAGGPNSTKRRRKD
jgi:hypothetical protein